VGRRRLINLVLLVLVGAAAALLLTGRDRPQGTPRVTHLAPASIDRITVEREGQAALGFARQRNGWRMTEPLSIAANPDRINAILELLVARSRDRIQAAGADLRTLNLDPAPVTVHVNGRVLRLGGTDPVGHLRYVLYNGTVHLVKDTLFPQLIQPAPFFVDTRLLPAAAVSRITFPDRTLYRDGDGWHGGPRAAATAAAWQEAAALRVLPYGEPASGSRIVIQDGKAAITFEIIDSGGAPLLGRADLGIAYQLSRKSAADLGLDRYLHD
jgi:hypothetical protein